MKITFIDSGVLLAAVRGTDEVARRAMEVLDDPDRTFASSVFVRLEVLSKALYNNSRVEAEFYEAFFATVSHWAEPIEQITAEAYPEAVKVGLAAMDALHVAAAAAVRADELVTTEKHGKPIHRVTSVSVRTIHPQGPK
jgi:predicted nucleic acid-binding protein